MGNFYYFSFAPIIGDSLYWYRYEYCRFDYAATLYEQICFSNDWCNNIFSTVWYLVSVTVLARIYVMGKSHFCIYHCGFRNLDFCLVYSKNSI